MTGAIQFGTLGVDTGPFYIYSDVNGFTAPFEQNINRAQLLAGYPTDKVPDDTNVIRVVSLGSCQTSIEIIVDPQ
jgi:hypothetical protein|tara:strand:+ start:190 stop:414 length:225 start_codon:yes stop_codon:yes gene_type:complete